MPSKVAPLVTPVFWVAAFWLVGSWRFGAGTDVRCACGDPGFQGFNDSIGGGFVAHGKLY